MEPPDAPPHQEVMPPEAWVEALLDAGESSCEMMVAMRVGNSPYRQIIPESGQPRMTLEVVDVGAVDADGKPTGVRTLSTELDVDSDDARTIAGFLYRRALDVFMATRGAHTNTLCKACILKFVIMDKQGRATTEDELTCAVSRKHLQLAVESGELPEVDERMLSQVMRQNNKLHTAMFAQAAKYSTDQQRELHRHESDMGKRGEALASTTSKLVDSYMVNTSRLHEQQKAAYSDGILAAEKLATSNAGGGFWNSAAGVTMAESMSEKSGDAMDLALDLGKSMLRMFNMKLDRMDK